MAFQYFFQFFCVLMLLILQPFFLFFRVCVSIYEQFKEADWFEFWIVPQSIEGTRTSYFYRYSKY